MAKSSTQEAPISKLTKMVERLLDEVQDVKAESDLIVGRVEEIFEEQMRALLAEFSDNNGFVTPGVSRVLKCRDCREKQEAERKKEEAKQRRSDRKVEGKL